MKPGDIITIVQTEKEYVILSVKGDIITMRQAIRSDFSPAKDCVYSADNMPLFKNKYITTGSYIYKEEEDK